MAEEQNRTLQDKFMLRLPDGLRDRIKFAADAAGRSMNQEIVRVLLREFPAPSEGNDFGHAVARFMNAYHDAEDDAEKAAVLTRMRAYLESHSPDLTAYVLVGSPMIISKRELAQLEARGPSLLMKLAEATLGPVFDRIEGKPKRDPKKPHKPKSE